MTDERSDLAAPRVATEPTAPAALNAPTAASTPSATAPIRYRQPDQSLLAYYTLTALLFGPLFPVALLYRYFRYRSLRYYFDDEGVTMRWGILFRREVSLTYARIQDIHLTSNVIERWFGLAQIQIQTASGSAGAEMVIEGLKDFEALRDDLYLRMRGMRDDRTTKAVGHGMRPGAVGNAGAGVEVVALDSAGDTGMSVGAGELATALQEAAAEIRRLRESLAGATIPASGGADRV